MHKRITVLLSEEEYTQVRKNAGLVPLSRFLKNLGLAENPTVLIPQWVPPWKQLVEEPMAKFAEGIDAVASDHREENVPRNEKVPARKRRGGRVERVSASVAHCEHGVEKGWHCWQCGGLAKVGGKEAP